MRSPTATFTCRASPPRYLPGMTPPFFRVIVSAKHSAPNTNTVVIKRKIIGASLSLLPAGHGTCCRFALQSREQRARDGLAPRQSLLICDPALFTGEAIPNPIIALHRHTDDARSRVGDRRFRQQTSAQRNFSNQFSCDCAPSEGAD